MEYIYIFQTTIVNIMNIIGNNPQMVEIIFFFKCIYMIIFKMYLISFFKTNTRT